MTYPDGLKGVFAPPEFHDELAGAYDNQCLHLANTPQDTDVAEKLSVELDAELRQEKNRLHRRAVTEYLQPSSDAYQVHEVSENDVAALSVSISSTDAAHLIEGLLRQSATYGLRQ